MSDLSETTAVQDAIRFPFLAALGLRPSLIKAGLSNTDLWALHYLVGSLQVTPGLPGRFTLDLLVAALDKIDAEPLLNQDTPSFPKDLHRLIAAVESLPVRDRLILDLVLWAASVLEHEDPGKEQGERDSVVKADTREDT